MAIVYFGGAGNQRLLFDVVGALVVDVAQIVFENVKIKFFFIGHVKLGGVFLVLNQELLHLHLLHQNLLFLLK